MMRDWRRLYRVRGFMPFGVLLVVILAVLVVADVVSARWDAALQERDDLQQRLALMRTTVERGRRIDAALEAARGRATAVSGKIVTASDTKAAGDALGKAAENWLVGMGAIRKSSTGVEGGATAPRLAACEVAVRIMPRQLLRTLAEWQQAPLAMRLVRLELTVDNPDSPAALEALFRMEGVYQSPASDAGAAARGASERRPAGRQDAR
jgi:hypothetical protein